MLKKETFTPESLLHTLVHFLGVLFIYWCAIFLPLWVSILLLIAEIAQMKLLGRCFLTKFAHSRHIMVGKTYWEYVTHMLGAKDFKRSGYIIDVIIKFTIVGILSLRIVVWIASSL